MADGTKPMSREELIEALENAEVRVKDAYLKGIKEAVEFDAEMDTFLVKFMKREDSSVIVFAIALGLVLAGGLIGYLARGIL